MSSSNRLFVAFTCVGAACVPIYDGGTEQLLVSPEGVGAVALPVTVAVFHQPKQLQLCLISRNSDCTGIKNTPLELERAECDDGACEVGSARTQPDGTILLPVTGLRAGRVTLHVTARGTESRDPFARSVVLEMRAVESIRLTQVSTPVAAAGLALLPGARVRLRAHAFSSDGTLLAVARDAFSATVDGAAMTVASSRSPGSFDLIASATGEATVKFTVAALTRALPFRVVDPAAVSAFDLRTTGNHYETDFADPNLLGPPQQSVEDSFARFEKVLVLHLSDGTHALGGASQLRLDPATFGEVNANIPPDTTDNRWVAELGIKADPVGTVPSAELWLDLGDCTHRVTVTRRK